MGDLSSRCIFVEEVALVPCKTQWIEIRLVPQPHGLGFFIYGLITSCVTINTSWTRSRLF
jgi:hypothetical protein